MTTVIAATTSVAKPIPTIRLLLALCLSLLLTVDARAEQILVQGLFKGAAVLTINGQQRMLRDGQTSDEGITVVKATPKYVVVSIDGKQQRMTLSQQISSSFQAVERGEVTIARTGANQYITNIYVNGRRIEALVDTGASTVALSEAHARQLDLQYDKQHASGQVTTASGVAKAYHLVLRNVSVGGITVNGVPAVIVEGNYPSHVLLGMSYLRHIELSEKGGIMTLKSKY